MNIVVLTLIEVLVVIGGSRLVGWAFRSIGQPLVIGEIVAGIALGPSLLGWLAPDLAGALFPVTAIPFLNVLSQIGLIFFMFLIGLELDPKYLQGNLKTAVVTSGVSILVPFSLAGILSLLIYPVLSNNSVSFTAFTLFLGAAMSITAFPVLARIITENNLQNTRLGTLALTCAAVDDVTAWCLLALAIAVTRTNSMVGAVPIIIYSVVYIGAMLTVGRWLLNILSTYYDRTGKLSQLMLAGIYMAVVSSALITEAIGIHLIFGAFLLGAAMPKNPRLVREVAQKTEDFVLIFLLPVFFAYSGLKTQIGLLNSPELWLLCLAILGVAIVGKYVGTYYAARSCQIDRQEASALGWLMNTRGLTELIVLNIGLELGVISPILFTMLVIMALVTTFMTSPLLEWTYPKKSIRLHSQSETLQVFDDSRSDGIQSGFQSPTITVPTPTPIAYRILVPVANPNTQKGLLQLAASIAHNDRQSAIINPLSLIELEEDYLFQSTPFEANRLIERRLKQLTTLIDTLEPIAARSLFQPIVQIGYDVSQKTAVIAALDRADLVLLGWHRPTFTNNRLGGRVAQMLGNTPADMAVFIDANNDSSIVEPYQKLLVPYTASNHDDLAVEIALRMLWNDRGRHLELIQIISPDTKNGELSAELDSLLENLPTEMSERIKISTLNAVDPIVEIEQISRRVDLTITGIGRTWGRRKPLLDNYTDRLAIHCVSPLLIARRYSQFSSHLSFVNQLKIEG
ncbi:cation:proton antiporter [Chamaesiphon sp. VAR_48_metabat_135_sub]|uniref:cation:proton antiporter n=1 Tax=Chamaesiphon sp. VAR_48_metabat_135_sub TaxID=2964699 RepID=UPI00286D1DB1|nr:cation:proton antiporter [Chamaesiphon sp. VAR_48_metabat_135_sub]